ncbi:MAG TPA: hypothetical protein VGO69_09395 [Pyrinomonadaceae bacterium]|nr:hypothetical protein [Pyrinomonadaceae bacterium]
MANELKPSNQTPSEMEAATPPSDRAAAAVSKVDGKEAGHKESQAAQRGRGAQQGKESDWEKIIPWFLTVSCTLSLICIALFLILNVEWFKASVFNQVTVTSSYKIYVYHMHLSMIKRSVGLFSGFAMMFVGASVCFYIVKAKTDVGFKAQTFSLNLMTTSPGIIAMVLGASLIMFTIWSKDEFPSPDTDPLPQLVQPQTTPAAGGETK